MKVSIKHGTNEPEGGSIDVEAADLIAALILALEIALGEDVIEIVIHN